MDSLIKKLNKLSVEDFKDEVNELIDEELFKLKEKLDDLYYNTGEMSMDDEKYDYIKDRAILINPIRGKKVGAKVPEKLKVKLPYWLGSMDKIYPKDTAEFTKWKLSNPSNNYFISEKLDGVSCLLELKGGNIKLYTRGDGSEGTDITSMKDYIKGIPLRMKGNINVRGELIIPKKVFEEKYMGTYKNPRNMVSGIVNTKNMKDKEEEAKDIKFVAYEIITQNDEQDSPSEQFRKLFINRFFVPFNKTLSQKELTIPQLEKTLNEFRMKSEFEIDGIIIQSDIPYERSGSGNPSYAIAFKMQTEVGETTVLRVEWNVSMRGQIKPTVVVKPIKLSGVEISRATGINAKYIVDNKIGKGAVVRITRSGEVIPKIIEIVKSAKEADLPQDIEYEWNETRVDFITEENCIKILENFFRVFKIPNISEVTIEKMVNAGMNTLLAILKAKPHDFERVEGFAKKSAQSMHDNIHKGLQGITMAQLMTASSLFGFGFGEQRAKELLKAVPNIFNIYLKEKSEGVYKAVRKVPGFGDVISKKISDNLYSFLIFVMKVRPYITFKKVVIKKGAKKRFEGEKVVMTGFRSDQIKEMIEEEGGKVSTSVSGNTTLVIAADANEKSEKLKKARDLGIKIISKKDFEEKYINN